MQLIRLIQAVEGQDLIYVTTDAKIQEQVVAKSFYVVPKADRLNKIKIIKLACKMLWVLIATRPDVVISTGALPGFFALYFGKKMRAKTIWLDSIANSEQLSLSGQKVGKYADLWLTQWEHLARPEGPYYWGNVL